MRDYSPGKPLVFTHIPKCAGTSLTAALIKALSPTRPVIGADLTTLGGFELDGLDPAFLATVISSPEDLPADTDFVAGHYSAGSTMTRFPHADHITMLRNPRNRVLSQCVHSRSLSEFDLRRWGGSFGDAARLGRLPFVEHLQQEIIAPNIDNTITRFLTWPHPLVQRSTFIEERHDDELLAAAMARLERFAHIDVVENPSFMAELGAWLGRELPATRANERSSIPRRRRFDLDAELTPSAVGLLDHRTRIDQRIWARVVRDSLDDDPMALIESTWKSAIDRYATAMDNRGEFRPVRQSVVALYELKARIGSRSH